LRASIEGRILGTRKAEAAQAFDVKDAEGLVIDSACY
jgi:hypothetical protein